MRTLIKIDKNQLEGYREWNDNNANWNIQFYLDMKYDLNAAIAFSKLFFPDFIERKGCVILDLFFREQTFEEWFRSFDNSISKTEKMCNLFELKDYFRTNDHIDSEELYESMLNNLGRVLKTSWELNLEQLYPNRKFKVDIFEENNSKFITLYSKC